jgi:DnaJ family protein C protein 13
MIRVQTIQLESEDSSLFSKTAPLLAAASECAYHTVRCSALNAEELRSAHTPHVAI